MAGRCKISEKRKTQERWSCLRFRAWLGWGGCPRATLVPLPLPWAILFLAHHSCNAQPTHAGCYAEAGLAEAGLFSDFGFPEAISRATAKNTKIAKNHRNQGFLLVLSGYIQGGAIGSPSSDSSTLFNPSANSLAARRPALHQSPVS